MKIPLKTILFLFYFIYSPSIYAAFPRNLDELVGTYVGCGYSTAYGNRKMVLHISRLPGGEAGESFEYSGSFAWADAHEEFGIIPGYYFDYIKYNPEKGHLFMRLDIDRLKREYGKIINTLSIDIVAHGKLKGDYQTNAIQADGNRLHGNWLAQLMPEGADINKYRCQ